MPQAGKPLWLRCLIKSFGCYWFVLWAFVSLKSLTWFCFVDNFQVDSANKRGSLLEVVQVLTDSNLLITDQHGNKLSEDDVAERIQQVGLLNWLPF
jgi:hypothetical protein